MRILDKYTTKYFLAPFFYCLITFVFLYIIIDLFGHLDEILKQNISIFILYEYYLSMTPIIIMQTAPVASLISIIYVLGIMNKYGETTAMRAVGISISRILLPFIYIGLGISLFIFILSEKIIPQSMKHAQSIKENYIEKNEKNKPETKKTITSIAFYGRNNRLIFIDTLDLSSKTIRGITILQQDKKNNVSSKINIEKGRWINNRWVFSNLLIYKLDSKGMVLTNPVFFKEKSLDIEKPKDLMSKGTNYEYMSFKDLSNYVNNFPASSSKIITALRVELHKKISLPFTSLVVILLGAGFAIRIKRKTKATALMGVGLSILIGFLYYVVMATCLALGKSGFLPPFISAHLANIVFAGIGISLIKN